MAEEEPVDPASVDAPALENYEGQDDPENYDMSAIGTNRMAAPPDGRDEPWYLVHPEGAKELGHVAP